MSKAGKQKKPLTEVEKKRIRKEKARERSFLRSHRSIFERAGFQRLSSVDGIHFDFEGIKSELDDIFVYENVVVFAEYTLSGSATLGSHAKGKAGIHNKISSKPADFLAMMSDKSEGVKNWLENLRYSIRQLQFSQIYASDDALEDNHKALFDRVKFMTRSERGYLAALTKAIRRSSRFEIFQYLDIDPEQVGVGGAVQSSDVVDEFKCLILPEEQSHFPKGFKVVSFYVDPDALLRRSYVLRRNGWKDGLGLYQRMIIPAKIASIRKHLKEKKRVFANNVVITLPHDSRFTIEGQPVDHSKITRPTSAQLCIPRLANTIGIVDGQHRIFSYFEDAQHDPQIDLYRVQQNLLATGLVYPASMTQSQRERFEAGLFLEINSTQASASSDIIQAIWVLLDPFKPISVARVVVDRLADTTPLKGRLARNSLDAGKIKTASIVAYGLQPLTKRSGEDSLFFLWDDEVAKARFNRGKASQADLDRYLDFCVSAISKFLNAIRVAIGDSKWRLAGSSEEGILSVTTINGMIIMLRKLIASKTLVSIDDIPNLDGLKKGNFASYKSSQYADLATHLVSLV